MDPSPSVFQKCLALSNGVVLGLLLHCCSCCCCLVVVSAMFLLWLNASVAHIRADALCACLQTLLPPFSPNAQQTFGLVSGQDPDVGTF